LISLRALLRRRWLRWALAIIAISGVAAVAASEFWPDGTYYNFRPETPGTTTYWGDTAQADFPTHRSDERTALRAVLRDPAARTILGSRYRVVGDERDEPQVVVVRIRLLGLPRSYSLDLPYIVYSNPDVRHPPAQCRYPTGFRIGWYHAGARGVTEVLAWVDLRESRMVGLEIGSATRETVSWVPGRPHPGCPALRNPPPP